MHVLGPCSPAHVVATWLRGELPSPRFGAHLARALREEGADEALVTSPDLRDRQENERRLRVLHRHRPWLTDDLDALEWRRVRLTAEEVLDLRYLGHSYWDELSDHTRVVRHAAANVRSGTVVLGVGNGPFWQVADLVARGCTLPPILLRPSEVEGRWEILEGHVRATAHALCDPPGAGLEALAGSRRAY